VELASFSTVIVASHDDPPRGRNSLVTMAACAPNDMTCATAARMNFSFTIEPLTCKVECGPNVPAAHAVGIVNLQ
jgi:hypothetical protein